MIIVNTGNGKGKTTAALGQAMRAVGEGKRVLMVQFIKGPWKSGEDNVEIVPKGSPSTRPAFGGTRSGSPSSPAFKLVKMGRGFVGILGDKLPIEEHRKAAEDGLALARREIESGHWDMVILDEINNAVHLNLVSKEAVLDLLHLMPNASHLVLTGRAAPQEFVDAADLVTEMRDVKHPYEKGIKAKRGLEY